MVFVSYQRPSGYENILLFSSKSFMVSPFPFRSLICQKLILVYGEQRGSVFTFPLWLRSRPRVEKASSHPWLCRAALSQIIVLWARLCFWPSSLCSEYGPHCPNYRGRQADRVERMSSANQCFTRCPFPVLLDPAVSVLLLPFVRSAGIF